MMKIYTNGDIKKHHITSPEVPNINVTPYGKVLFPLHSSSVTPKMNNIFKTKTMKNKVHSRELII